VHEARLGRVGRRHDHGVGTRAAQRVDERQHTRYRADGPVEPELAEHAVPVEHPVGQLAAGGDQAQCDRELETGTGLAHKLSTETTGPMSGPQILASTS
jgi:hypothetical protein